MSADLSRLLRPRSIAVIGGGWGLAVVEQCLKMGFKGDVWPVHPTRGDMHGARCYRSIADLPGAPDAVFIGVNRHLTIEAVQALSARGAGGAICFASGFAEAEDDRTAGADLQARLIEAAGQMPIVGPNCYGLINYLDGALLWPDQHGGASVEAGVAILSQSSNIAINISMQQRGLPVAYLMCAGNQAQTGLSALAMAAVEDPRVTALGLHIEGFDDPAAFHDMVLRARELGKPVVALKIGRSEAARAGAVSHTASLAGSEAATGAFLRRLGVPNLRSLPAFLETLKLLHLGGPLSGRDIVSMSCSGGEASLIADMAEDRNLTFPPFTEARKQAVKDTLNPLVAVANPLDYHTFIWADQTRMTETFASVLGAGFDLSFLILDFPREDRCDASQWDIAVDALCLAARRTGARTAIVASLPECLPEICADRIAAAGLIPMIGLDEALAAAEAAAEIGEAWRTPPPPAPQTPPLVAGRTLMLDEAEAKDRLAAVGLKVPAGRRVDGAGAAADAATELGFPVAVKALGLAHKTEAGGVALNLADAEEVRAAAAAMPGENFLVERMAPAGVELIVGVTRDPVLGLLMTIGAGGVLTELLDDSASVLLPASRDEIGAAISGLRVDRLLAGYRGKPAVDRQALLDAVGIIAGFALTQSSRLEELDVNPLIAGPTGAVAVDALITLRG